MPFTVQELIEGRALPVSISPDLSVGAALDLMIKHDFSTLPIVDADRRVQGIVTSDSILRGLHFTKTTTANLNVIDVKTEPLTCLPDDDIFDVLERMRNNYACLVVDSEKRLVGIITDFDTSEYFRGRAENIMLVEDIEKTLKDFISFAYPPLMDGMENPELAVAVQQAVTPPRGFDDFKRAIAKYTQAINPGSSFNVQYAQEAFDSFTARNTQPKAFDDLTMAEYISLLLNKDKWPKYEAAIRLDKDALTRMLDAVRLIRNDLAYFRGGVSDIEQKQLRYCLQWLENHQSAVYSAFQSVGAELDPQIVDIPHEQELTHVEPLLEAGESRYAPLARFLKNVASKGVSVVILPFDDIEKIIGASLPSSARSHRSWWANDSVSRVQSKQWLSAGWRVKYADIQKERAIFEAYENFKTPQSLNEV